MNIDRLLARFSIQTKVIVLVIPLIAGIAALTAISLYTGSMLGGRLVGTSASIETLSGFKEAYAGMTSFLQDQNEQKRAAVMQSLDAQLARMETVIALAENTEESNALDGARVLAEQLRTNVDNLWTLSGEETDIRTGFGTILTEISTVRDRLNSKIEAVATELAEAESEAKGMLRSAEQIGNGAQTIVRISSAISGARTPEDTFKAANDLKAEITDLHETLPAAIPATKPAVKSLIADNLGALLSTLQSGVSGDAGMISLQKYANALRPTGITLQGLGAQVARKAMVRFGELDQPILEGQQMITDARGFLAGLAAVELSIAEFVGNPVQESGEALAAKLSVLDQSVELLSFSDSGAPILETIGDKWIEQAAAIPGMVRDLISNNEAKNSVFAEASDRINQAWSGVLTFASSQQHGAEVVKERASGITLTAAAAAGLFGLLAVFMLISALKRPILRLVNAMRDVASGDLDTDVSDNARADEIGEMARALDVFKHNAIDKIRVEDESERARDHAASQRQRADAEKQKSDEELRFAVESLGQALRNLSQGDLVATIDTPFSGELDSLRTDFNESVERMRDALHHIRDNARSITDNSAQLRSAADDLSRRTEQQAASLEQTAAAVDQISSAVRTASGRATDTDKLAGDTANDARASGEVVSRAVDAMGRIEEASGKIGKIIGVIDEIAFQTNLLALNAGVEAARAGEAGRGFAVVAQEVRELAGRSATAAKEIKQLIADAGDEVRSGVSLVGETGEAITRIIARIEEISAHVGAMATASREQATGLGEVNTAVNQMDQMTQQNAAMVEETNASSHTLAQEAAALSTLVAAFRLDLDHARQTHQSHAA
ncbi:methyl-accepting chemotaxis protein [Hoeflea sp.]|uniref:methyl-accepting chemotaxis protein n=1 Tax=Hoeflea sp. TaxID=1940281 RepID=UPI003A92C5AC